MQLQDVIGQDYTLVGTGKWLRTLEHSSLVVNVEDQIFFWNSRGIYGTVKDWYEKVKKVKYKKDAYIEIVPEPKPIEPVSEVVPLPELVNIFHTAGLAHRQYWYDKRGYTDETIDRFKLGYSGDWYTIPIYEFGKFVNFQCKNYDGVKHWYRGVGPHTFGFGILKYNDWVVITEGPVDAIMLRQNNIPAVSQTSGAGDVRMFVRDFYLFNNIKKIYVVYDNDSAGQIGAKKIADVFGSRVRVYNMWDFAPKYDVTDFFKDGHKREDFMELLQKSKEIVDV